MQIHREEKGRVILWDCRNMNPYFLNAVMHAPPQGHIKIAIQLAFPQLHKRAEQWPLKDRDSSGSLGPESRRCSEKRQTQPSVLPPGSLGWVQVQLLSFRALQCGLVSSGQTGLESVLPRHGASNINHSPTTGPPEVCTYMAPLTGSTTLI